jgi:predicted DNA-binding antitoxin AbrB/MazE fold protein
VTITIDATYENGVLRPVRPLPFEERQRVEIIIRTPEAATEAEQPPVDARQAALKRLMSLELPVADWPEMEDQIIHGAAQ